jgi:hypothetical protein
MKKLMSLMLGLAFIAGSVTVVLADDAATAKDTTKTTAKKTTPKVTKAKKTTEEKKTT